MARAVAVTLDEKRYELIGDALRSIRRRRMLFVTSSILIVAGCNQPSIGTRAPAYQPDHFRNDIEALIADERYEDAVAYLSSADPTRQAKYDKSGYLAVGEDDIVLPGVYPDIFFDRSRDWFVPGTQDAILDLKWQQAATRFAEQYNRIRAGD